MNINTVTQDKPLSSQTVLRQPVVSDGVAVNRLVSNSPPLDENSIYCNLLQCMHFAETSCAAEMEGELVGFISGYLLPEKSDTLFIWQVTIAEAVRNQGLARKMLNNILQRHVCSNVRYLQTTITKSNKASWKMFRGLAEELNSPHCESLCFSRAEHFSNQHDDEYLLIIGPFENHAGHTNTSHPDIAQL